MQHTFLHQKMVAYESLDHNIFLIRMWQLPRLDPCATVDAMLHARKSQFREKNPLLIKKVQILVVTRMPQHVIIHCFCAIICQLVAYGRYKTMENFKL